MEKIKKDIQNEVQMHQQELVEVCLKIHANPEVGWKEVKSSRLLSDYLERRGFEIDRGICDIPTAFRAQYGRGDPVIAFMAEYDALPEIGHGCGHNIIGTAAVGAGIASKFAADKFGGTILVFGTPAEEYVGGKVIMAERGAFKGIDVAMMVHPRTQLNLVGLRHLAVISLDVEFWGKAAHAAAAPWDGISALESLILAFNNINALRFHTRDRSRISGVITDGGRVPNVVPDYSAGKFSIRAPDDASLDELCEKVLDCFKGAALSTGARLEYRWGMKCASMRHNLALIQLWTHNMQALGRKVDGVLDTGGSTDMGNVSMIVPAMHPFIAISSKALTLHSAEFADAARSSEAMEALIDATKALAMTAADVISEPETLSRVKEEFFDTSRSPERTV
jgi:amidohydrolase